MLFEEQIACNSVEEREGSVNFNAAIIVYENERKI